MKVGIQLNFYLGQPVVYDGHTGILQSLSLEDNGVMCTVALDEPIVIPPAGDDDREIKIYSQYAPIHEIRPAQPDTTT